MASSVMREGYLDYVADQVRAVGAAKTALRRADRLMAALSGEGGPSVEKNEANLGLLNEARSEFGAQGIFMFRLDRLGLPQYGDAKDFSSALGLDLGSLDWGAVKDITGETLLARMSSGRFPPEGDFAVLETHGQDGAGQTACLALLRPEADGQFFSVTLTSLGEAGGKASLSASAIVGRLSDLLREVSLPAGASIVLLDRDGAVLTGKDHPSELGFLSPDLLARAREEGPLEEALERPYPLGLMLARIESFRPLDWSLVLMIPRSEVIGLARRQTRGLLVLALIAACVAFALSVALGRRLAKPIEALAERANQASSLDFSSPSAAYFFEAGHRSRAKDEIGRLSEAFDSMGRSMVKNVNDLLAATRARDRLDGELSAARGIQMGILPPAGRNNLGGNLATAAALEPAKEVGGDLYDCFEAQDGRAALIIGDVSGKGVPAALFMSVTVTLVRQALTGQRLSPAEAMTLVNRALTAHNPQSMFVTLFIGLLDPLTGALEYANGGHCQPIALGTQGLRYLEGISGPVVGALEDLDYQGLNDRIAPGELLLLYTDGVTEAQNQDGDFFGLERLKAAVLAGARHDPAAVNDAVLSAVKDFRGEAPPSDDVALLSCVPK
jgi:sigma-B regulation protein RsbU (phosphoserine phosphatase)